MIAFDRPGFGFSERPRNRIWGADEQGALLHQALVKLDVKRPVLVGHSWGALVALAMALRNQPDIAGLALLSGYYFPSLRSDVPLMFWPAVPLLGDVLRYTISPLLGRLTAPAAYRKMFAPAPVARRFASEFPIELSVRPWQIRAAAADAALMIPAAASMADRYDELSLSVAIIAGAADRIIDFWTVNPPVSISTCLVQRPAEISGCGAHGPPYRHRTGRDDHPRTGRGRSAYDYSRSDVGRLGTPVGCNTEPGTRSPSDDRSREIEPSSRGDPSAYFAQIGPFPHSRHI